MKGTFKLYSKCIPQGGEDVMMHRYSPEIKRGDGAVIIFPGGGYNHRAPHEGEPYALALNEMGIEAFVVEYRVAPSRYPSPLSDAREAVRVVRKNAETWQINPEKIAVMGSSAGGHLASLVATSRDNISILDEESSIDNIDFLPNAEILCYPVTDIHSHRGSYEDLLGDKFTDEAMVLSVTPTSLVDKNTAIPTFIWHTSPDNIVDIKGTYRFAAKLSELGASVEMHVYPIGGHGLGLANGLYSRATEEYVQVWIKDLEHWLGLIGWIN